MRVLSSVLTLLMLGYVASTTFAADAGTVVVGKAGEHAIIVWDASPVVHGIVTNKTSRDKALRSIERDAIHIAAEHVADLISAKTIGVRVVYTRSGAISPAYGNATFSGVERVVTVTAPAVALEKRAEQIAAAVYAGKPPQDVRIEVTGSLPPP
jgi:hypothetical protein